ncbi:lipoate--protein ligase family protein [Streptococcus thoraltensis]|uniref:lipoate--protein ligase family protein n=1 Tax=Streptococcus thoraltensis TaxID=55085 RepID=UPI0003772A1E|nr:lipoate--protein ligase family protein [Streptococcus thoraltensis]MDY4761022.1 lipoate--protein ligase family protein [Streptococcus thoraltensis]
MSKSLEILSPLKLNVFGLYEDPSKQTVQPFAWADTFLRYISQQPESMILHFWPMENIVILGMLDRQVPYFEDGLQTIKKLGYQPIVRNIGGLGVISDDGVLNFSLILPNANQLSINDAYLLMVDLIRDMFNDFEALIEHFEVPHSYCPGTFDLSIKGKKFAGIAQRRIKDSVVISIYLSVYGDQDFRGRLVKSFYESGIQKEPTTAKYPDIDPECMANLSDLLGTSFSIDDIQNRAIQSLEKLGMIKHQLHLNQDLMTTYEKFLNQHLKRNVSTLS